MLYTSIVRVYHVHSRLKKPAQRSIIKNKCRSRKFEVALGEKRLHIHRKTPEI